jgi:hypothetical protein
MKTLSGKLGMSVCWDETILARSIWLKLLITMILSSRSISNLNLHDQLIIIIYNNYFANIICICQNIYYYLIYDIFINIHMGSS